MSINTSNSPLSSPGMEFFPPPHSADPISVKEDNNGPVAQAPPIPYVPKLITKVQIITTLMSSGKTIGHGLTSLRLVLMTAITLPHQATSNKFKASAMHSLKNYFVIWSNAYFKDTVIKSTINLARRDVLLKEEDRIVAEDLLEKMQANPEVARTEAPRAMINNGLLDITKNGVCCGLRIDIAQRRLLENESIESIIEDNEKGARAEAAGNQLAYDHLSAVVNNSTDGKTTKMHRILHRLEGLKGLREEIDGRTVAQMTIALDGFLTLGGKESKQLRDEYLHPKTEIFNKLDGLFYKETKNAEKLLKEGKKHEFLMKEGENWIIYDYDKFRKEARRSLNDFMTNQAFQSSQDYSSHSEHCKKIFFQLDVALSLLEEKNADLIKMRMPNLKKTKSNENGVSNENLTSMRRLVQHISDSITDSIKEGAVAQTRGLKLTGLEDVLGYSTLYPDDATYLQGLPQLPVGVYAVDIKTSSISHAITYVRENNVCYVLDPNGFQVTCKSPEDAVIQMQKIINLYSEPKSKVQGIKNPHHEIEIKKFEVA